jgi:hypothetical protein
MSLDIKKALELQRWIIDPSSRPYKAPTHEKERLVVHSAGETVKYEGIPTITVQQQLELQKKIIGD